MERIVHHPAHDKATNLPSTWAEYTTANAGPARDSIGYPAHTLFQFSLSTNSRHSQSRTMCTDPELALPPMYTTAKVQVNWRLN